MFDRVDQYFLKKYARLAFWWTKRTYTSSDRLMIFILYLTLAAHIFHAILYRSVLSVGSAVITLWMFSLRSHLQLSPGLGKFLCILSVLLVGVGSGMTTLSFFVGKDSLRMIISLIGDIFYTIFLYAIRTPNIDPPPKPVRVWSRAFSQAGA